MPLGTFKKTRRDWSLTGHVDFWSELLNVMGEQQHKYWGRGKAVPLQAWSGPVGFQEVKVHRFHDNGTGRW